MKRLNRGNFKYCELNLKLRSIYDLKQKINNSKMPKYLKHDAMHWCDCEINKYWRWSFERRKGYSVDVPKQFQGLHTFRPVCPFGYRNCVADPAYIRTEYPSWYKELYGDQTPWQAASKCREYHEKYPEGCPYFDDEDK